MFYGNLFSKYRPRVFSDIVAQSNIINIFRNSISNNNFHHSYIFYGLRGSGKTTLARIISKSLNCEMRKKNTDPCLRCVHCIMIEENRHPDIIEIDAASNSSVSNIRNIIENIKFKPIVAYYKIYIIDEVHMLSYSAFNSLLKVLEEPPLYIKFILITTEIRKVPLTIISRCYKICMSRIYVRDLAFFLQRISIKEKVFINLRILFLIAKFSQGSIRDGVSILGQTFSLCKKEKVIDTFLMKKFFSGVVINYTYKIFFFVSKSDIYNTINITRNLYLHGYEGYIVFQDLIDFCYKLIIFKIDNNRIVLSNYEFFKCRQLSYNFSLIGLIRIWKILTKSLIEIKNFDSSLVTLEMLVIRLCNI